MRSLIMLSLLSFAVCLIAINGCGDDDTAVLEPETPDETAPAAITDLACSSMGPETATLQWTATGDDEDVGTAAAYSVRYSPNLIDSIAWPNAMVASGPPTPKAAGSSETFTVTGLASATHYYFAVKARDEASNWSGVSSSPDTTTDVPDYHNVTPHGANDYDGAYSPDGQWIAFTSERAGEDIFIVPATGGAVTRITAFSNMTTRYIVRHATWSPDSDSLAFECNFNGSYDIWAVDVGAGAPYTPARITTDDTFDERYPEWSNTRGVIAFSSNYNAALFELFYIDPQGPSGTVADWTQLTSDGFDNNAPTWSPDDSWLAYYSARGSNHSIFKIAFDNPSVAVAVTTGGGTEQLPEWSPDPDYDYIVFQENQTSGGSIFDVSITPSSGGAWTLISANDNLADNRAGWSPDARRVIYTHWSGNGADVISKRIR